MKKYLVDDTEYYVRTAGSGPIMLFAHGFPFDSRLYEPVVERLQSHFFCVVPDLRGFGMTKLGANGHNPQGAPRVKMGRFADDLAILVSEIACQRRDKNAKIILCGLSMGGYVSLAFARRRPERLAGLVFCDSNATQDSPEKARERMQLADSINALLIPSLADAMVPNLLAPETPRKNPHVVVALREMIASQSPEAIAAGARGMAKREDSSDVLPRIEVPTLVLGGEFDKLSSPASLDAIASAIPDATRATVADSGHVPPMENPDGFADAVIAWYEERVKSRFN